VAINILAYQHGIYPRSEEVVAATRGLDRGRTARSDVEAAFDRDLARWIEVQRDAGLDLFSDGLLRWQDIFRPLVEGLGGKPHTLVRWFDTNTFFRQPEFGERTGRLTSLAGAIPDGSVPAPRVATLPSPYMFSRAARTEQDRNQLMQTIAGELLRPVAEAAAAGGARMIHLEEPWLSYRGIDQQDWAPLRDALAILHRDLGATLALHVYFGDAGPFMAELRQLPVDAIGIDLIETDVNALGTDWKQDLVAGVINGRQSTLESVDRLVEVARHLADQVRPRNLYLSSSSELGYLPTAVAEQKVQRLGDATRKLKELVSV
jgi:5-methyltetrahydropteroyltriglutamate--homocysteine methyltransferase